MLHHGSAGRRVGFLALPLLMAHCGAGLTRAARAEDAAEILRATGVHGGLVVHVGCGDGKLTAALRAGESRLGRPDTLVGREGAGQECPAYLVQGLDADPKNIAAARAHIAACGLYGDITARTFDGKRLPYIDNLVNLMVIGEGGSGVAEAEVLRVLAPGGVAVHVNAKSEIVKPKVVKPWPAELDEWTHYQHDPQGTMVSRDRVVGPPQRIQWVGEPKWLRNHDFMSSMHAMVSSGGRVFYIIDEGLRNHIFLPAHWALIARDGFNGVVLWRRPLPDWYPANWPLKSGPGYLPRRLVAVGDRVFATLGFIEPVTALEAATGRTIRTYDGTRATEEVLASNGVLYLLVDPAKQAVGYRAETSTYGEIGHANSGWGWSKERPERSVVAVEAESGKLLWKHTARIAPLSLTVGEGRVFFCDGEKLIALDRASGRQEWASPAPPRLTIKPATGAAARVVYSGGVVVLCASTQTFAFAADTGKLLWEGRTLPSGHFCPNDLFVINGLIWSAATGSAQQRGTHFTALDLRTGETRKDLVAENLPGFPMHPRCYPSRATERYIMTAGMGTEFYEVGGNRVELFNYVRGSCIYGVMPCNGLLYKPPDSCACYYLSKLEYFCALAPAKGDGGTASQAPEEARLERGPVYAAAGAGPAATASADDWPMYRRDAARSGASPAAVPAELKKAWAVALGGRLTQPVIAGGKVFVASVDAHVLYALDAAAGKVLWKHIGGGRIDSPPTLHRGAVLFGSADGWVNCLRGEDGAAVWRYRVAPDDRQLVSCQRPESIWPVSGSVLLHGGVVYALAGRNMFFDGGMRLVRLDAATGAKLSETVLDELDPETGKNLQTLIAAKTMPVANPDLLSCDGKYVYMAKQKFDLEGKRVGIAPIGVKPPAEPAETMHLFSPTGFLDDTWFHRTYWIYGESCGEGWGDYNRAWKQTPSGRLMVFDQSRAYGFRPDNLGNTLLPETTYRLYAADTKLREASLAEPKAEKRGKAAKKGGRDPAAGIAGPYKVYWQIPSPPLLVNAMVLAGGKLFVAGPPDVADEAKMLGFLPGADDELNRELKAQDEAWRGKMGALLWVVAAEDGNKLAEYKLESIPVWDGMSVAGGRLFMSLKNGAVACWERK